MADTHTVRLTNQQHSVLDDMVTREMADNKSEALRMCINSGMADFGYSGTETNRTTLRYLSTEFAKLFSYSAIAWLAFFWAFPVSFRIPGVFLIFAALGMVGVTLLLDKYEPRVSNILFNRGESA